MRKAFVLLLLVGAACSHPTSIVGKWKVDSSAVDQNVKYRDMATQMEYEFTKDGKLLISVPNLGVPPVSSTWAQNGSKLTIKSDTGELDATVSDDLSRIHVAAPPNGTNGPNESFDLVRG